MPPRSGALQSAQMVSALVSPLAQAHSLGPITWVRERSRYDGIVPASVVIPGLERVRIHVEVNTFRPTEPRLQYLTTGGWARRLCVNRPHPPLEGTHKHYVPTSGAESAYEPTDIPRVALAQAMPTGRLRAILEAFAAECSVELNEDFAWVPPWEGI